MKNTMKTKRIISMSVLPALIASGFLVGCASQPVGELTTRRISYEKEPGLTRTREVRRTISPVRLERISENQAYRTRAYAEPVAERTFYRTEPRTLTSCDAPVVPYSGNSPSSPSQWW